VTRERFLRCKFCSLPHSADEVVCPTTGKTLSSRDPSSGRQKSIRPPPDPQAAGQAHRASTGADDLADTVVAGKYLVHQTIGRGGMATVYDAEQLVVGRPVALKVLDVSDSRSHTSLKRFRQEAQIAANLPHPHICQVYDFGELPDGSPFIAMERLHGESLAERIRREGALPIPFAVEAAVQVLGALHFAHKRGVVHRDIKPENIFVSRAGRGSVVKLLDFGLSKVVAPITDSNGDEPTQLTRAGITMGTPYYMAPEQAFGDRDLDARVDLWAVGVTLYESLVGQRPFRGTSKQALMRSIVSDAHPPLHAGRPTAPPALEAIIARALAKDRGERYASAVEFQHDLVAVMRRLKDAPVEER
jgi:serine/threonine-protein kinase